MSALTTSVEHYTECSSQCNNIREIKGIQTGKEDVKLSDNIIINLENTKEFTKNSHYN